MENCLKKLFHPRNWPVRGISVRTLRKSGKFSGIPRTMKIKDIRRNAVLSLSIDFAIAAVAYCEQLNETKRYVVAKQLMRSATSIGANIMEAQQAESNADFIHKLKIAAKEAAETQYWLIICEMSQGYGDPKALQNQLDSINRMLSSIIATCKSKDRSVPGGDDSID